MPSVKLFSRQGHQEKKTPEISFYNIHIALLIHPQVRKFPTSETMKVHGERSFSPI
jgi:hypothetical protein